MITIAAAVLTLAPPQAHTLADIVQRNFKDASFLVRVTSANHRELTKINKDFGQTYRFKTMEVKLKEPFKVRLQAKVEDTDVLFVLNGVTRVFSMRGLKQRENLAWEPGKRQTPLDFGFLTPSMFDDLFKATYVRVDRATGDLVFDIHYTKPGYKSYYRVWVDKEKRYTTKREWYDKNGQKATFHYSEPQQDGGVWLPTKLRVKNVDDKVAGETNYEAMKVNRGLSDDLFNVR